MVLLDFDSSHSRLGSDRPDHRRLNAHLLKTARHVIHEDGFEALTMSRLAEEANCARKTVYNHFENRVDVLLALSVQSARRRADMASRASTYKAGTRERMVAIGSVFQELLPYHIRHEAYLLSVDTSSAPERRHNDLRFEEERIYSIRAGVVRDAIARDDLHLPEHLTPEGLAMTIDQLYIGHYAAMQRGFALGRNTREEAKQALRWTMRSMWDGLGWRPLFEEFDYPASVRLMWKQIFPELLDRFHVELD